MRDGWTRLTVPGFAQEQQVRLRALPMADGSVRPEPVMDVKAVTDAVLYMAGLPLEANVPFMTVMATAMPLIGRG